MVRKVTPQAAANFRLPSLVAGQAGCGASRLRGKPNLLPPPVLGYQADVIMPGVQGGSGTSKMGVPASHPRATAHHEGICWSYPMLATTFKTFCGLILFGTLLMDARRSDAAGFDQTLQPFFARYCADCHADGAQEGGLAIDELENDLGDPATFAMWQRIHDRVLSGEMPPRDSQPVSKTDRSDFLRLLAAPLRQAHLQSKSTVFRRLNRREYQNTMNDLFGTELDLASQLPPDGRTNEFDNVGESLTLSMVQLQQYLRVADQVMDAAIAKHTQKPKVIVKQANYAETREGQTHIGKDWKQLDDGAVVFFRALGYPTGMLRTANVQQAGRYNIRVTGYAYQSEVPITFAIGATTFQRGARRPTFAYRSLPPGEPTTIELQATIDRNYMIELTTWGIADRDNQIRKNGIENYPGPGLAILNVELEGPLVDEFPSRGHRLIFDGLQRREIEPGNPNQKLKPWYTPQFEVVAESPAGEIGPALHRVAETAFRRPVTADQVEPYLALFESELDHGKPMETALRTAVAAIFCSPDFLFLREREGRLDDYAVASRLSYFLTRTAPDAELMAAAKAGRLTGDRQELVRQTRRLLNGPRSERFIVDFTDAWLNLRDIEFTSPDQNLFPEFDAFLQFSMLQETRRFLRTLIDDNAPVGKLIKPDYAMLNNRLAKHYGIPGVTGPELSRVNVSPDGVRGGLLGQASVLKVSANGTNTSPVVRGVWVTERILGQTPPPPPPGIAGVEPDVRGASTLRELLAKHRDLDSCQNCHAAIDPPGFALESFDPIGGWRQRFRSLGEGQRVNLKINGRKVRYKLGPPVDASGKLADGTTFEGFKEFRDQLAHDQDRLARTLITKLLTFATGREMGFSDREMLDQLVVKSRAGGHGIGNLIELVVQSDAFLQK
ncbi:MAG: DUF1592 domain-containing protein [Pirellulales bacterium]|nr:DUF1592 domain-containing protein [Pirellulales bacterium]